MLCAFANPECTVPARVFPRRAIPWTSLALCAAGFLACGTKLDRAPSNPHPAGARPPAEAELATIASVFPTAPAPAGSLLVYLEQVEPVSLVLKLVPGQSHQGEIRRSESHELVIDLAAGTYFHLEVEQLEGDLFLEVSGPGDRSYPRVDSSADATRIEPLLLIAESAGTYRIRIGAYEPGRYEARIDPPRDPTPDDRLQVAAHRDFYRARLARRTDPGQSAGLYTRAIEGWNALDEVAEEARAWFELGEILAKAPAGQGRRIAAYERAASLFAFLGDSAQRGRSLHRLGGILSESGDLTAARNCYQQALEAWRTADVRDQASFVAYDLAEIERRLGHPDAALVRLEEARDLAADGPDLCHLAKVQTTLGSHYFSRGEIARAIRQHRLALRLLETVALDDVPRTELKKLQAQRAVTLSSLATKLPFGTEPPATILEQARDLLEEARDLRIALGDQGGLATTVNNLGLIFEWMALHPFALAAYREALGIFRQLDRPAEASVVLANQCRVLTRLEVLGPARACYTQALRAVRAVGYRNAEAQILLGSARIARRQDDLASARSLIDQALEVIEAVREETGRDDLRASFIALKYDYYAFAVDLALTMHVREPTAGHADTAFYTLERARARGFLEALVRVRPELRPSAERRALRDEINRIKIASLGSSARGGAHEAHLDDLLSQLYATDPRYALADPPILAAADVRALLDTDTVLLVYYLGEQRGAVWAFTDTETAVRPLPPRREIESLAKRLHQALSAGSHRIHSRHVAQLARELSVQILAPVADFLSRSDGRRQLAIVPTGALRYIPFTILPHPADLDAADPDPLLLGQHVTSTPSVSVLAALRDRHRGRRPAPKLLALVAAPVLRADDPRLADHAPSRASEMGRAPVMSSPVMSSPVMSSPGSTRPSTPGLPATLTAALPYAEIEAAAILDLVGDDAVLAATGLAANRDFIFSAPLDQFRVLHFATHGHLDNAHGELSGLVLSQFDAEGNPVDGFLWSHELYELELNAELVVLSACQTALGEEIRGEGILGLTRGFFFAGAERVLVSLWNVGDEATARLMSNFYRGLFQRGLPPAEALRQAQIALRAEGWDAAHFWAPFILEGDFLDPKIFPRR